MLDLRLVDINYHVCVCVCLSFCYGTQIKTQTLLAFPEVWVNQSGKQLCVFYSVSVQPKQTSHLISCWARWSCSEVVVVGGSSGSDTQFIAVGFLCYLVCVWEYHACLLPCQSKPHGFIILILRAHYPGVWTFAKRTSRQHKPVIFSCYSTFSVTSNRRHCMHTL